MFGWFSCKICYLLEIVIISQEESQKTKTAFVKCQHCSWTELK